MSGLRQDGSRTPFTLREHGDLGQRVEEEARSREEEERGTRDNLAVLVEAKLYMIIEPQGVLGPVCFFRIAETQHLIRAGEHQ